MQTCRRIILSAKFIYMKMLTLVQLFLVVVTIGCVQKSEVFSASSQAIRGYDPVAYFTVGKATKGSESYVFKWQQANWYFSSKENLDSFAMNPEKYAPQYGGFCAYACSNGRKAPTDPNAWAIIDGKLYLNKSLEIQEKWNQDQKQRIEQANKNWPEIKNKN